VSFSSLPINNKSDQSLVRTFEDYKEWLPELKDDSHKQGHLFDKTRPLKEIKEQLDRIKGHLVWMPLDFLCDAEMAEKGLQVNVYTESIYT
jgi:phospholipase D1/2